MEISVVVPVYGCPSALPELYRRIVSTIEAMGVPFEIVLVDDCDEEGSWEEVKKIALQDKRVKALHFTHNCGQDRAITAGVRQAKGEWVITMDCDLQDAPEHIAELYRMVKEKEVDVVFVRRNNIKASPLSRFFAKLFHRVFSFFTEIPFDYEIGTYLIASKRAAEYYKESKDRGRDFGMFLMWLRFDHDFVVFEHETRYEGKSSYSFKKKVDYAIRMMTSFSNRVLYLPIHMGAIAVIGSFIYLLVMLIYYFAFHANPEGWTTIVAAIFFFGGLILSTLGVIGIYLGNVFDMNKDRPLYIIKESMNCGESS